MAQLTVTGKELTSGQNEKPQGKNKHLTAKRKISGQKEKPLGKKKHLWAKGVDNLWYVQFPLGGCTNINTNDYSFDTDTRACQNVSFQHLHLQMQNTKRSKLSVRCHSDLSNTDTSLRDFALSLQCPYCQRVRPSGRPEGLTRRQIIEP